MLPSVSIGSGMSCASPGAEDESGRGLAVIEGLVGLRGSISVRDDADGDGKTVHVSHLCGGQPLKPAPGGTVIVFDLAL